MHAKHASQNDRLNDLSRRVISCALPYSTRLFAGFLEKVW